MTGRLFETPAEVVDRAARLLDPEAFDSAAVTPWGDKRWAGTVGKRLQAAAQNRALETARVALSAVFPDLGVDTLEREEAPA